MSDIGIAVSELDNLVKELSQRKDGLMGYCRSKVKEYAEKNGISLTDSEVEEHARVLSVQYGAFLSEKIPEIKRQKQELIELHDKYFVNI